MKGKLAGLLLALSVAYLVAEPSHALTCGAVDMSLSPCIGYLTGQQRAPAAACCAGVRKLRAMATTTADHRLACNCMKQAARRIRNIKGDAVSNLPRMCGAPLPFPVSLNVDCSRVP